MFLLRLIWAVVRGVSTRRADLVAENLALRHDFDFMGAILSRITIENGPAERPQSAGSPPDTRRSSFGTLRVSRTSTSTRFQTEAAPQIRDL